MLPDILKAVKCILLQHSSQLTAVMLAHAITKYLLLRMGLYALPMLSQFLHLVHIMSSEVGCFEWNRQVTVEEADNTSTRMGMGGYA